MILVAIGANLPGPESQAPLVTAQWAVGQLAALPGLQVAAVSRWYLSDPVPPSAQPPYVNAVVRLSAASASTEPDPAELLSRLQTIEAEAGRRRTVPNAARPLDLDIIAMGQQGVMVRASPDPVLPHPRAHLRAFVLLPLRDVAPDWCHPVLGGEVGALIAALPPQGIRPLDP